MILILRGHIRDSFKSMKLYFFVENLYKIYPDLKIFIHTWNIFANNISWRKININEDSVNDTIIYNYFGKLNTCIKHIIIDCDKNIQLFGRLKGNINNGLAPIIGWKNYWYGKYKIIDYLYNQNINQDEMIVNCRFDIFNNSNSFNKKDIEKFITDNTGSLFTKNKFIYNQETFGIDNIYIGNINTMYKLICSFHYNLDLILKQHNNIINQEILVYRINNIIF
jgi:hypothetical protein